MDIDAFKESRYVPDSVPADDLEFFVKGGFGERIGFGETPAVVVVDMTLEFTGSEYSLGRADTASHALDGIARLLERSREADVPIFYTKPEKDFPAGYQRTTKSSADEEAEPGHEDANAIHPDLEPAPADVVISKPRASAFFDTHLSHVLHFYGVDTLIVTGMTTSGCVRATAVDSHSSNFQTIVPIECVADRSTYAHEASLFDMDMKYADVVPLATVLEHVD